MTKSRSYCIIIFSIELKINLSIVLRKKSAINIDILEAKTFITNAFLSLNSCQYLDSNVQKIIALFIMNIITLTINLGKSDSQYILRSI
jgi:hypothetical protein